jgi:hypothetical protein
VLSRRHSSAQAVALRCRIVLACAEGESGRAAFPIMLKGMNSALLQTPAQAYACPGHWK